MKIHGWGRYSPCESKVLLPYSLSACADFIVKSDGPLIAMGLGRSYGDSANASQVIHLTHLDHFIEFDKFTGVLACQAGVSIKEILQLIVPNG